MVSEVLVITVSGYGLLPDGTKPFPEPMLTHRHEILWHSFQGNVYLNTEYINPQVVFEIYTVEITATSPRGQVKLRGGQPNEFLVIGR